MGFRDRLKDTAKSLLGRGSPEPRPEPPRPPPAKVEATPAPAPTPAVAAPPVATAATPPRPVRPGSALPPPSADGWHAVARSEQVTEKKAGTYPVPGVPIVAVFRHGGRLYAIDNACAHEDGPVGEGDVAGTCVRCPYHDWEYDYTTGACKTDPERALATFAVREGDGYIWVGPRLTEGTKARGGDHNDGMETITR